MADARESRTRFVTRFVIRCCTVLTILVLVPLFLIVGCQSKLIYYPRPYHPGQAEKWASGGSGLIIDYETSQGRQRAFLQGNLESPRNLWLVGVGNASVALENSHWISSHGPQQDAWLIFDPPGYGDSEGSPNQRTILESWQTLVPLAREELSLPDDPQRLRFFGHSLGGAACLIAASEFDIRRGVLISPFTSTMDMAKVVLGLPLGFLVTHRYDNTARLDEVAEKGAGQVFIIHGARDSIIPVSMSRRLAERHPKLIQLREIPHAGHNDIQSNHADAIAAALREAGEPEP